MRRKSSRNQNKSLERSPQRSSESLSGNTRSTRRRKKSPSEPTSEVEGNVCMNEEINEAKAVEDQLPADNVISEVDTTVNTPNIVLNESLNDQENNSISEASQECADEELRGISQEVKGKCRGKKTKFNQSRIDIEPETENDNVQEISESPPNDNNESAQKSTDSSQMDVEKSKITDNDIYIENKEQCKSELVTFESEYIQNDAVIQREKVLNEVKQQIIEAAETEERSTTPALPKTTMDERSTEQKIDVDDDKETSEKNGKKRITLKRIPPSNLDEQSKYQASPCDDGDVKMNKTSKKVSLKRKTIDESPSSDGKEPKAADCVERSMNDITCEEKAATSQSEKPNQHEDLSSSNKLPKRIKLIRNSSLECQEEETSKKTGKQSWGRSEWLKNISATMYKIDVESIKTVCPSVEFLKESDIKLKLAPRERIKSESSEVSKRKMSLERSEDESEKQNSEPEPAEEQKIDPNPNIIAQNRKISIVDDTASKMKPPASPAKNPKSDILYITNLVRPFTVKQLKELLERTGKIRDDGFWTDRIKSKCYAQYESEEEAEATRNALHGVGWPIGNGKQLVIDFATEEDMQKAKNPVPAVPVLPEILPEKENRFQAPEKLEIRHREQEVEEKRHKDTGRDRSREEHRRRHSRSRSRVRRHSRRSYTPEVLIKKNPKKEDVPQKLMDDLFLKTKATPSIYWQPLCPQEIALKQQQRLVRMEEHKRRIEETRTRVRDVRRAPFRRR